jgi:hypothetical protein
MKCKVHRSPFAASAAALVVVCGAAAAPAQFAGPNSSLPSVVLPNAALPPGSAATVALLTAGDYVGGYRMAGIPDGLGAFVSDAGAATALLNHELYKTSGLVRAHGSTGAFVSRWTIDPTTFAVTAGRDHNVGPGDVRTYDRTAGAWVPGTTQWSRFCSSDLAPTTAFEFGGLGTSARILLNGEEIRPPADPHGRAFAHVVSGASTDTSWELPHLGQCAFENLVASPFPQAKTIVVGLDDSSGSTAATATEPSELYVYVGTKLATGGEIERAGLVGGSLYGVVVKVGGVPIGGESGAFCFGSTSFVGSAAFELFNLGDASTFAGPAQAAASVANDVTRFQRLEDGAWDPRPGFETDFYFTTPASINGNSRLFRLRFADLAQPELGGTIDAVLVGSEGPKTLDNLCVDPDGRVFLQEDPGGDVRLAKTWMYDLVNGRLTEIAAFDPAVFSPAGTSFLTTNEESSGVIDARDLLGPGWYLTTAQIHVSFGGPAIVEPGQLVALYVRPDLGRAFELGFSAPLGAGSLAFRRHFGAPNAVSFAAVSLAAGNFPHGQFFGIDVAFGDVIAQVLFGAPFVEILNADGAATSATFVALPSGLALYGVAIDDLAAPVPRISAPTTFTIP